MHNMMYELYNMDPKDGPEAKKNNLVKDLNITQQSIDSRNVVSTERKLVSTERKLVSTERDFMIQDTTDREIYSATRENESEVPEKTEPEKLDQENNKSEETSLNLDFRNKMFTPTGSYVNIERFSERKPKLIDKFKNEQIDPKMARSFQHHYSHNKNDNTTGLTDINPNNINVPIQMKLTTENELRKITDNVTPV